MFSTDREGKWDLDLMKRMGLNAYRVKACDALFFFQLSFHSAIPKCPTLKTIQEQNSLKKSPTTPTSFLPKSIGCVDLTRTKPCQFQFRKLSITLESAFAMEFSGESHQSPVVTSLWTNTPSPKTPTIALTLHPPCHLRDSTRFSFV